MTVVADGETAAEIERILARPLTRITDRTITDAVRMRAELALVRKGNRLSLMPVSEEQWRVMLERCQRS